MESNLNKLSKKKHHSIVNKKTYGDYFSNLKRIQKFLEDPNTKPETKKKTKANYNDSYYQEDKQHINDFYNKNPEIRDKILSHDYWIGSTALLKDKDALEKLDNLLTKATTSITKKHGLFFLDSSVISTQMKSAWNRYSQQSDTGFSQYLIDKEKNGFPWESDEIDINYEKDPRKTEISIIDKYNASQSSLLSYQKIFFGAPGTGKSTAVKQLILEEKDGFASRIYRTTFHPDYDYATFVGAYKPRVIGKELTYSFVPQVFAEAYVAAWAALEKGETDPIYLVIEEINRGNCAQIFGDLFQLLDRNARGLSEYTIRANVDFADWLSQHPVYSNLKEKPEAGTLRLPPNLLFLATMNTSDQSLFPMDSAFKRRWDWEYVPIKLQGDMNALFASTFTITLDDQHVYSWFDFLRKVNPLIRQLTSSEDKQMGPYFITHSVGMKEFISKVLFYLWSDICKDEYMANSANFMKSTEFKATDGSDSNEFTFNELFEVDEKTRTTILVGFMKFLELEVKKAETTGGKSEKGTDGGQPDGGTDGGQPETDTGTGQPNKATGETDDPSSSTSPLAHQHY